MLCALVLLTSLIVGCVLARPKMLRAIREPAGQPAVPVKPAAGPASRPTPQTLEGALTRQLVTGEITGPQYRHAMATLAARDAERHPLEVPPEADPTEGV